jgi:hypothetical protein
MNAKPTILIAALAFTLVAPIARAAPQPPSEKPAEKEMKDKAEKRRAIGKLLQIIKSEPSAKEVQTATLRYYKLEPERIDSMARAARLKGLVPEIETGIDRSDSNSLNQTADGQFFGALGGAAGINQPIPNPLGYKDRTWGLQDSNSWHVKGVWNLDRLVFNAEGLDVKSLNSLEENLVREVTTLYFSRRRLLATLILNPPEEEEEVFYELQRLDELTATLDALTGGMFAAKAWKWDAGQ